MRVAKRGLAEVLGCGGSTGMQVGPGKDLYANANCELTLSVLGVEFEHAEKLTGCHLGVDGHGRRRVCADAPCGELLVETKSRVDSWGRTRHCMHGGQRQVHMLSESAQAGRRLLKYC